MKLKASKADHEKEKKAWINERKDIQTKIDQFKREQQAEIDKISKEKGELYEIVSNLQNELNAKVWVVDIHVDCGQIEFTIDTMTIILRMYKMSVSGQWDLLYDEDRVVYTHLKLPNNRMVYVKKSHSSMPEFAVSNLLNHQLL